MARAMDVVASMLKLTVAALTLTMLGGLATADRDGRHNNDRGRAPVVRNDDRGRAPAVRGDRGNSPRVNRPAQRANRRVMNRNAVYANNGHFVFASGARVAYTRPALRVHDNNARVRPPLLVESYPAEPGYIWVRGNWYWSSNQWRWNDGHFVADPQYSNYYDDGSYDYSVTFSIGG